MVAARASFPTDAISAFLRERHPGLVFVEGEAGRWVQGTYDLTHDGTWIASYLLRIDLPDLYRFALPTVQEIGGRIPKSDAYHVNADGSLCLGVPEELWIELGGRFDLHDVVDGPLRTFLLGATNKLKGRDWPYGERPHGACGLSQWYGRVIGSSDPVHVLELVQILTAPSIKGHWMCPCGSGRELRKCHGDTIRQLHAHGFPVDMLRKSGIVVAAHLAQTLDDHIDQLSKIQGLVRRLGILHPSPAAAVRKTS